MSQKLEQNRETKPHFQPAQSEPAYTEGGKFGRQEGQPGSKGPVVQPTPKQAIQHPHNKQQATGGGPEEHPKSAKP
ncbi:MAG TPA: hypothetical protein VFE46_11070 [Pirellulales bacterium]|jgi:hypothetical protein|nr:hypothetical protein [Pirellulales bacterium]